MIKIITKTLQKNSNVLEVTDNAITDTSIFEIYPSDNSTVLPQQVSVSGSTLSIVFDGKASANTPVKIMINNVNGLLDAEDIPYTNLATPFYDVSSALTGALNKGEQNTSDINDLADIVDERVPDEPILGGVLYHSTTGNIWKKLDASNIDYDEQSTIYSAMGDIDDLETSSKNIVGAINEVKNISSNIYSNNEVIIGYWFNKPLYRKVISTTLPNCTVDGSSAFNSIDVLSLNMDFCIRCECMVTSGGYNSNTPYFSGDNPQRFVRTYVARSNGVADHVNILNANTGYNGQTTYLIIEYTKTTD